ncbi:hypothetical protein DPEC_G00036990 [Dallia pectoralis]|uniref:Uncharacterized protein n=1 Tax=Dallia pectoralis TaxID=75939 RepID=A0ACC2HF52_DALPE|nr:hypothetical protein DPEC_G00036990 [Dallia pectoralis]
MVGIAFGPIPGTVRVRSRRLQVMLNQRKTKARRKRRKECCGGQMCAMGLLLALVTGISCLAQKAGFDVSSTTGNEGARWETRKLLQESWDNDTDLYKNCTEPDTRT